jgi:hypothetical protein
MGVYHAGEDGKAVAINLLARAALQIWPDGGDTPVGDADICRRQDSFARDKIAAP